MNNFGLNFGYLLVQILSLVVLLGWIILTIGCLLKLRRQILTPTVKAIWVLIIVAVPLIGAIAYLVVKPTE
jgi:hypothetical protein